MRKLVFLFAIFFSLAGVAGLSHAQDEAVDGEALLEAQLPEGVTLETATAEQVQTALQAVVSSGQSETAVNAAVATATAPGRANSLSAAQATTAVVAASVSRPTPATGPAAPSASSPEPDVAGRVIANIITRGNLSSDEVFQLVRGISNVTAQTSANSSEVASTLQRISAATEAADLDAGVDLDFDVLLTIGDAVRESANTNTTCTVSNSVVTCTNA